MRKNKKAVMAVSFCLGAVMLATTAFADITSKTGYDQLKDSIKYTAESLSKRADSHTLEATMTLKDNDKVIASESSLSKVQGDKNLSESTTVSANGQSRKSSSYSDKGTRIWYSPEDDTYNVIEYTSAMEASSFRNPFEEDRAKDVEKIFDAVVGNLKDYVVVEDKNDGSKVLSGSLSESQIPALVNAVASFAFKQEFGGRRLSSDAEAVPQMVNDIYVKNVTGKANVTKEGLVENVLATGILSGKDKDGNPHDLTIEVLFRLTDVNKTVVVKPDLTGKKVEKRTENAPQKETVTQRFVGKYKNDIVIVKDDRFVKIGERVLEITSVDDKHVTGKYTEQYTKDYADKYTNKDFSFDAPFEKNQPFAIIKDADASGQKEKGTIHFDTFTGRIYFNLANNNGSYDSTFTRVFDN